MSTFTDALAALTPDELRGLVRTRPDAFFPAPPSPGALATRLALPGSVALGLRTLTAADLLALERLAGAGAELSPVDAGAIAVAGRGSGEALARLRERAFIYGPDDAVRIAPGTLSGLPAGWRISDQAPVDLAERMARLDARQRRVLETLAAAGGTGTTRAAAPDADPETPVAKLIAAGLLVRVDAAAVRLPRPVREALAGPAPRVYPMDEPPAHDVDQAAVDQEAAGQGLEFVRQTRQLVTELLRAPVPLNRDGSVGVRALATLEKALGFDPSLAITVGESAGLVGRGNVDDADVLAATRDGLGWLDAPLHEQWAAVLTGWVASPWRTDSEHRLLSTEMHAPDVRHARRTILQAEGDTQRLLFQAPIAASGMRDTLIAAVVSEALATGALAGGSLGASAQGLSSPLLALLAGGDVAAAARGLVPAEVDQVIAQADMTILAPGPLVPESARFLERFAELDSPGLASVWRVTVASVRSALAGGVTSAEIHEWLRAHAIGEVPQGMAFLIDDIARTHGSIRAGSALSYIRSEDPTLIATAAERTGVRVLAPTVAVSGLPLTRLVALLRDAHLQPTAEDERGVELSVAPEPDLVPATPSTLPRPKSVPPAQVERIIEVMRSSAAAGAEDANTAGGDPAESTLETLRAAARGRRHVKLGYVDKDGRGATLTALPLSVNAGQVDVLDEATDRVVRIALPRITRVVLA